MKKTTTYLVLLGLAAAAVGCTSSPKAKTSHVDEPADLAEHNRLMVRMALAENVYQGTAADRAVYPEDFDHGVATLNDLGQRRVETLIHAYRGGSARIVVLKGDEPTAVYDARVATVRQQFADAGFNDKVEIAGSGVPANSSSGRGVVSYDRMMSTYKTPVGSGGDSGNQSMTGGGLGISNK